MEAIIWMQRFSHPVSDVLAQAVTILGEDVVSVVICALFLWCIDKRFGYRLGFVLAVGGVLNGVMKNLFRVPRPWDRNVPGYIAPLRKSTATGYSFPSGHSQNAATLGGMLGKRAKVWQRFVLYAMALAVGISRIYCRVHTWQDVLFGLTLGFAAAAAVDALVRFLMAHRVRAMLWLLCPAAAMLFVRDHDVYKICGLLTGIVAGYVLEEKYIRFDVRARKSVQILKMLLGISIVILIRAGMHALFGESLEADAICNMLIGLFVSCGAPLLFRKIWGKGTC